MLFGWALDIPAAAALQCPDHRGEPIRPTVEVTPGGAAWAIAALAGAIGELMFIAIRAGTFAGSVSDHGVGGGWFEAT